MVEVVWMGVVVVEVLWVYAVVMVLCVYAVVIEVVWVWCDVAGRWLWCGCVVWSVMAVPFSAMHWGFAVVVLVWIKCGLVVIAV